MDAPDAATREHIREHVVALDTLRHAKSAAFWLAVIAILAHVGAWYVVRYTTLLDPNRGISATTAQAEPMNGDDQNYAHNWQVRLEAALGVAGFLGRATVVVLLGLYILSLLVTLSARLGGSAGMAKATVWTLLCLALLVPWDRFTPDEINGVPSAFYNYSELSTGSIRDSGTVSGTPIVIDRTNWKEVAQDALRYAGYPLLVLIVLIAGQVNFRNGYRRIVAAPTARLPMREV